MSITNEPEEVIIKDMSNQSYRNDDEEDFHIKAVEKNTVTDYLPERDDERAFEADMYNFGDTDDLPDSDRIMECQSKGISQKKCLDV